MIAEIISILLVIYLLINIISFLPWSKYFYEDVFYKPENEYLITIDDGPTEYTQKMLKLLKKNNQQAIFFLNGNKINGFEKEINQISKENHFIGNHSYKHYFFNPFLTSVIVNNLKINEQKLNEFVNNEIRYIRTPHGYQTFSLMKYLRNSDKKFVYWDTILLDFIPFIPISFLKYQVDSFIVKKGIICLHSNKKSFKILKYILRKIKEEYE